MIDVYTLDDLARRTAALARALAAAEQGKLAHRVRQTVIRPLVGGVGDEGSVSNVTDPAALAWELAKQATRLRSEPEATARLIEATAGLQRIAVTLQADDAAVAELRQLQQSVPTSIVPEHNGPYLVSGVDSVKDWLGVDIAVTPQLALCRCGQSATKPFCDGTHTDIAFTDEKASGRVPDRQETYVGSSVTVLDNRSVCAHSGFCSDRLPAAFRLGEEPFVAPSGGRMDEIVRVVRACPSGALGLAAESADTGRPPSIEVSRDGPYRVTGGIPLVEADGTPVARNLGASVEHCSLCRCGKSQNKPFCSGMHWYAKFSDPPLSEEPTLFEWCGGFPALLRMTRLFYQKYVPADPLLAPLFGRMAPDHPERVASWLGEVFGGPKVYSTAYGGYDWMLSQHVGKGLREEQRARWVQLMIQSSEEAGLPVDPEFRASFVAYLEWGSRLAVENSTPGAKPPLHMPVPRWWWVCDATPRTRVSALAPTAEEKAATLPQPGELVRYSAHIKPLFRRTDRETMRFAFDLWSYDDVRTHADAILARLEAGTMPCDGPWPAGKLDVLRRWVQSGKPE